MDNGTVKVLSVVVAWLAVSGTLASQEAPSAPAVRSRQDALPAALPGVVNYRLAAPDLAAGGVPDAVALKLLAARGLKTVIDLRTEGEGTAAEKALVEKLGMRYVHVPVTATTLSLADADAVIAALAAPGAKPALLHCTTSNRAGAAWALMEARAGRGAAASEQAGRTMGMRAGPMTEAVRQILAQPLPPPRMR